MITSDMLLGNQSNVMLYFIFLSFFLDKLGKIVFYFANDNLYIKLFYNEHQVFCL
jgi:hypothetical protein